MDNYKGIYYGTTSETKSFEGGAHFRYSALYQALLSLYNSLPKDKIGPSLHYSNTSNQKPVRTRNALISFNALPLHHIRTEHSNKDIEPFLNMRNATFSSNDILIKEEDNNIVYNITDYNDKKTRNHKNNLLKSNPNTKVNVNINNHQRQKSAVVRTRFLYKGNGIKNKIKKKDLTKKTPIMLTEGNDISHNNNNSNKMINHNNNTTTGSHNININNVLNKKQLTKPKIKSIKYQIHHVPLASVSSSEFYKNNSLYSILKKQEQDNNHNSNSNNNKKITNNKGPFHLNIKNLIHYKFKNKAFNFSLSKSNNKSSLINISNQNTNLHTEGSNSVGIQNYFYKDKKSRNERSNNNHKQNEMMALTKGFQTAISYNKGMLRDIFQSHLKNVRKQIIAQYSQSKSKEKGKKRGSSNNINNHSSQGSCLKYKKGNTKGINKKKEKNN